MPGTQMIADMAMRKGRRAIEGIRNSPSLMIIGIAMMSAVALTALPAKSAVRERDNVEDELKQKEQDWAKAVEADNADQIARFLRDAFLFVGARGALQNREQHLDDFRSGRLKVQVVKIEESTIHVYASAAIVSNKTYVEGTFAGIDITAHYQFTDTWVKDGESWLAAARQQTKILPQPDTTQNDPGRAKHDNAHDGQAARPARLLNLEEGPKSINGVELYCKAFGHGEPIVIVHGGPALDHSYLLPQFERLARHHRLIFYDQRASGRSTGATDQTSINMPTFIADLDGVRSAFGLQQMNLLGYSWGGLLSMSYAIAHPDKLKRLLLIDSEASNTQDDNDFGPVLQSRTPPAEQQELNRLRNSPAFQQGDLATIKQWLHLRFRAYFSDSSKLNDLVLDNLTQRTARNYNAILNSFDATFFTPGYDLTPQLPRITCPTLIVQGDYDPVEPKYLKKVSNLIPNANFWLLPHAGHFTYIEKTEGLFSLIDQFLGD